MERHPWANSMPDHYDRCLGPVMFAEPARRMARLLAEHGATSLLETAAGTGLVTREVANCMPAIGTYVATDLNPLSLQIAAAKFAPHERVRFETADAQDLPFADRSFDTVLCQFGMMLFGDKDRAYREVRRVLQPGGRFMFSVWDSHARNPFAEVLTRAIREFFKADPPPFFDTPYGYHSVDLIRSALQDHGFGDIRATIFRPVSSIPDPGLFAQGFVHGTAFLNQIKERGAEPDAVQEAISRAFERELRGSTELQYIFLDAVAR